MPVSLPIVSQALLEQTFAPPVALALRDRPELLAGRTAELSLLFADLRDFTSLTEGLAPEACYELLGDVLESLTTAVHEHNGVVVDYNGDGLFAMWNAPLATPEHADRACDAAQAMLAALPELNRHWANRLSGQLAGEFALGIGLHTGEMQVGNAGTRQRFKYGPRGKHVHVASRVEGATRQLNVPLLLTDATRQRLSSRFASLRVCTAKLPGLSESLALFTVFPSQETDVLQSKLARYEHARDAFEQGELEQVERLLLNFDSDEAAIPAAFLLGQATALRLRRFGRRAGDEAADRDDAVIELIAK